MVRKRNRQAPDADAGPDTQRASREDGTDSVERTRQHNGTSTNVHTEALASKPKQPPKSQPTSDMGHDRAPKAKSARAPEHAQIAADSRKPVEQQQKRPRRGLQYALTAGLLIAAVLLLPRVLEVRDCTSSTPFAQLPPLPPFRNTFSDCHTYPHRHLDTPCLQQAPLHITPILNSQSHHPHRHEVPTTTVSLLPTPRTPHLPPPPTAHSPLRPAGLRILNPPATPYPRCPRNHLSPAPAPNP